MVQSLKYAQLVLRLSLAFVFGWFGVDSFIHPQYWIDAWMPDWATSLGDMVAISPIQLLYVIGIFEVLIALSLITTVFIRIFALAGIIFLISIIITNGFSEIMVRDIGLIGALLTIVLWPERTSFF